MVMCAITNEVRNCYTSCLVINIDLHMPNPGNVVYALVIVVGLTITIIFVVNRNIAMRHGSNKKPKNSL